LCVVESFYAGGRPKLSHGEPSRVSCRRFVGGFDIYRAVCFSVVVAFIFFERHVPERAV
jgi:hypothetical protein